jgi:hypothetical protein
MKLFSKGWASILLYAFTASLIWASQWAPPPPEELYDKATLACTGQVLSITDDITGKPFLLRGRNLLGRTSDRATVLHLTAKIKILHIFKGEAPAEIEIKYLIQQASGDWPEYLRLWAGHRYRFFLQKTDEKSNAPSYVGVASNGFKDAFAAMLLSPTEASDSSFISKIEALELITKWMETHHPELMPLDKISLYPLDAEDSDDRWEMELFLLHKFLIVKSNRTVDERPMHINQ